MKKLWLLSFVLLRVCQVALATPATAQSDTPAPPEPTALETLIKTVRGNLIRDASGEVTGVNLAHTDVTDDGLVYLAELTALELLDLNGTPVTDAGMASLAGMTTIATLGLSFTGITDSGLAHLAGLSGLHSLGLISTGVTDAGLTTLGQLPNLATLDLSYTRITDAGLSQLEGQPLTRLVLDSTAVTDAGLGTLSRIAALRTLDLSYTRVTDTGVLNLKGLTALESLILRGTQVTANAVSELNLALPDCLVTTDAAASPAGAG